MPDQHCCLFTRGTLYMRDAPKASELCAEVECIPAPAYKSLGNISSAAIDIQASVFGRENPFNVSHSSARQDIQSASISLSINCINIKNLYQLMFSEKDIIDKLEVTHIQRYETDAVYPGDFFPFEKQKANLESILVKWVEPLPGTDFVIANSDDYTITQSGVEYVNSDGFDGWQLQIEYNYTESESFSTFTYNSKSQDYKSLYFKGVNYADGGEGMFDVFIPRVLFPPINQLELISQSEFTTIPLTGVIEMSEGTWYKIIKQED